MPLRNHFIPPLSLTHPWGGFHGAWATCIAQQLNRGILPTRYYAVPTVELGGPVEIDIATLEDQSGPTPSGSGAILQPWTPPTPTVTLAVDFSGVDTIEVQVFYDEGSPRLAAAIELVSPKSKDRPATRRAFAVKCASYLQQAASVIVIDVVTVRHANMHAELLQTLNLGNGALWQSPSALCVVAYRMVREDERSKIEIWPEALAPGAPLPRLPLWLGVDISVPLDLEKSYLSACESLRIAG